MAQPIDVRIVCPNDPDCIITVRINYTHLANGELIGVAVPCSNYRQDNDTCRKCHAYQCTYISYNGLPEKGQIITPDLSRYE